MEDLMKLCTDWKEKHMKSYDYGPVSESCIRGTDRKTVYVFISRVKRDFEEFQEGVPIHYIESLHVFEDLALAESFLNSYDENCNKDKIFDLQLISTTLYV